MLIDALAETHGYIIDEQPATGWGESISYVVRDDVHGRLSTLAGGEQVQAQSLGRVSTHRFYVHEIDAHEGDIFIVPQGDYAGTYRVRFVDVRKASLLRFVQVDLEYRGPYQRDSDLILTYEGEQVTFGGEAVIYA